MTERLLKREYVFRGKLLQVRLDQVEMPSGVHATREIVEHPGAVVIIPLDEANNLLLVRQYRQAVGRVTLELPAGTLDKAGEDVAHAAERELEEETGHRARTWEFVTRFYPSLGINTEEMHLYLARDLFSTQQATEADEAITVERLPLARAIEMVERGEIHDAKTMIGILLVARKFQTFQVSKT